MDTLKKTMRDTLNTVVDNVQIIPQTNERSDKEFLQQVPEIKKKIAVFFGGCSTEYEVSLQSAYSVIKSIDTECYTSILIGMERYTGKWFWYRGDIELIAKDSWFLEETCIPVFPSVDKSVHGVCYMEKESLQTLSFDIAFPVLHGKNGEDGTIQGVLELMDIPVIGCDLLSSALCMNKDFAHYIVAANKIKVAKSMTIKREYVKSDVKKSALELGYPLFVKPVRAGSSFGITKVVAEKDLLFAVENAFQYDSVVILEEMIAGFEVGCAILGTKDLLIGEVDEIELGDGFFNYTEKYTLQTSHIHVPARISIEKTEEIKKTALAIYRLLGCSYFARVDMFFTSKEEIYFNEVNTIPGLTSHSRYPNMLKAIGLSFEEMIRLLLKMER